MGIGAIMKATRAIKLQKKGQKDEAVRLYEEAFASGVNDPRYLLPYALLLIRDGQYQKAKDFLVAHQKAPGMIPSQRVELMVYYSVCCFRLGDVDKGVRTLEQQFRKTEVSLIYQTLGYLYVEQLDRARRPELDYDAILAGKPAEEPALEAAEQPAENEPSGNAEAPAEEASPEEVWDTGRKKAEAFILKSLDYDDEDPICLDNMGQFVYRVLGDRAAAREWFDKAIALKSGQIDTLWFLSRYDLEAGDRKSALEKLETAAEGRFSPLNYCTKERVQEEIARLKGAAEA